MIMNVPHDIADKVIDTMRGTPFVLALLIINSAMLGVFAFSMHEIANAAERRDGLLQSCIARQ
jgi:hypothetical protein